MYKYHPQWLHARNLVSTGELGQIINIRTFFSYNNKDPENIRNIKSCGGGGLMDIGCYAISVPRFLLGREPQRVLGLLTYDGTFETDIISSGILDFGRTRAIFTVSTQAYPCQTVEINGTGGYMTVQIPFNTFNDVPAKIRIVNKVGTRIYKTPAVDQYGIMFDEFSALIRGEVSLSYSPGDAVNNMKVIDALVESHNQGTWVSL